MIQNRLPVSFAFLSLVLLASSLPAQRLPVAGTNAAVAAFDVGFALPEAGPKLRMPVGENAPAFEPELPPVTHRLAEFLAGVATGLSMPLEDVQPLGGRYVVALGGARELDALEQLLAKARAQQQTQFELAIRIYSLPATFAATKLPTLLGVDPAGQPARVAVLDREAATGLLQALDTASGLEVMHAPKVAARNLQPVTLSVLQYSSYVKDYTVRIQPSQVVADPVVGTVWDGFMIDATCLGLDAERIAMRVSFEQQNVAKPIEERSTTLPGTKLPVTVQVPRVSGVRAKQMAILGWGGAGVLAAPREDGSWLVVVTRCEPVAK
jgi:hypothetical protein